MKKLQSILLIGLLSILFVACGGNSDRSNSQNDSSASASADNSSDGKEIEINSPEDISKAISEAMKQFNNGEEVEAVDFRKLKELLPEKLAGMKRTKLEGEKTGMGSFKYSVAKANYEKDDARLEVNIVDGAGFAGIVTGMAAWSLIDVDKESDSGYERTTTIDGYKAFESYDSDRKEGQVSIIVEDRFIVNIEADRIQSDKDLRRALKDLNLRALKQMI